MKRMVVVWNNHCFYRGLQGPPPQIEKSSQIIPNFFYSYLRLNLLHGFHKEIILESQRPLIHRRAWNVGLLYRELCDDSTLGQPL